MEERKLKGKRYNDIAILADVDPTLKFQYKNQNDFIKKYRSLKTYFPLSYKDLLFHLDKRKLYELKDGTYVKELLTTEEIKFVYGTIKLCFSVKNGNIVIENLEPEDFLLDGYYTLLNVYQGIPYRNEKDLFKIKLLKNMKEKKWKINF